jgi:endonuclease YncB( thermonuclease family)
MVAAAILCCLAPDGLLDAAQPSELSRKNVDATVVDVIDGNTVVLEAGAELRLAGIEVPKAAPGGPALSLAEDARAALERLTSGKRVVVRYESDRPDRYGRMTAHLYTADGAWVQGQLLMSGFARVWTRFDQRARVAEMLALEREARVKRRGIWADARYRIRTVESAERDVDSFQLVEGTVRSVSAVRGKTYLNFGLDWHTDFTIMIDKGDLRRFHEGGFEPRVYEGRRLRVRGWVRSLNGPMIVATHPEQIEVLAE